VTLELELETGWVGPELREDFPSLGLVHTTLAARPGRTPQPVRDRLRTLSNRFTGARAITLRQEPVPWAYRVFFRQIGLDPDQHHTPPEQAALDRMRHGGFQSRNLVDDALLVATVETGMALVALDADRLDGPLGLRLAAPRERLGGDGRELSSGQILLADASRSLGVLFGDLADDQGVRPETSRLLLAAVMVSGVPSLIAEEALWTAAEVLAEAP
jgi:DNA/RNA-binding domain of Phe-tRNA-synthetase-like protein